MDLNRVSAFVRVVQEGSFTSAAKALGVPKSSVSRSVAQLEEELGLRLLHRTTRKLHLTDAGAAYYERVARALVDIDEATSAAAEMQAQLRGVVRVTAPVDLGVWALAPIVARFARKHPTIQVDVVLTGRVVDLVAESVDLALRVGDLRDSSLVARRIGYLHGSLWATPKYLARKGTPASVDDLAAHDCVVFRPVAARGVWQLVDRAGGERSVQVTGPVASDDLLFVRKLVALGAGIGLVPDFLCDHEAERGSIVRVLPDWGMRGGMLHLVYPTARYVPQRVVAFRECLLAELAELQRAGESIARGRPAGDSP
jgi:DNA-binding transcriptional LysR family regulator